MVPFQGTSASTLMNASLTIPSLWPRWGPPTTGKENCPGATKNLAEIQHWLDVKLRDKPWWTFKFPKIRSKCFDLKNTCKMFYSNFYPCISLVIKKTSQQVHHWNSSPHVTIPVFANTQPKTPSIGKLLCKGTSQYLVAALTPARLCTERKLIFQTYIYFFSGVMVYFRCYTLGVIL